MKTITIGSDWSPVKDEDSLGRAKSVAIGVADAIKRGMYKKGYRNDMAVDFCIACQCLGVDPVNACEELELNSLQSVNMQGRISTISDYLDSWVNSKSGIWSYALTPYEWENWFNNTSDHALAVAPMA